MLASFSHNVLYFNTYRNNNFSSSDLSSANVLNFVKSKYLSFGNNLPRLVHWYIKEKSSESKQQFPKYLFTSPIPYLTLYLICQFLALPIQQQIKIWCQKYGQMGIQLSDWVENIVGKGEISHIKQFLLFPQCFQKLRVANALKWVSKE